MFKTAYRQGKIAALHDFKIPDHAWDLAGLGALSIPVAYELAAKKEDKPLHALELAGLGLLAVPSVKKLVK